MNKWKKDFIVLYLLRNALATLLITVISFCFSLQNYYQTSFFNPIRKIIFDNVYTTVYFLLVWMLDYLLFEIYKTMVDIIKKSISGKVPYGLIIPLVFLILVLVIDFNQLFKVNFILLFAFMILRAIKEMIKKKNRL